MDDATPHRAKLTKSCFKTLRLREADHPPDSLDLAPSDFYLFGKLKGPMAGSEFESTEDLLAAIRRLTSTILRQNVKEDWRNTSGFAETMFREKNLGNSS
jgi:hypothetical protein